MNLYLKSAIIGFVIGTLVGLASSYYYMDDTAKSIQKVAQYEKDQAKRDTVIAIQEEMVKKIDKERLSAIQERNLYKDSLNLTIKRIEKFTRPTISTSDFKDAEQWIKEYNSSLK